MARTHGRNGFFATIGQKVKHGVELFGKAKAIYDTGKLIYSGISAALQYVQTAAAFL